MLVRMIPILKALIVVLAVALAVVAAALVRFAVVGNRGGTPRTQLERGIVAAEQAVKADPQNAPARVKLAAAYLEGNSVDAALEQARYAVKLAPERPEGYYILGLVKSAKGSMNEAIAALQKSAATKGQTAPFYQDVYAALAQVQEKAGNRKAAIVALNSALDKGPENSLLLFELGRLYERDAQWLPALDSYATALQFVPDYEEARQAFDRLSKAHPDAAKTLKQARNPKPTQKQSGSTRPGK